MATKNKQKAIDQINELRLQVSALMKEDPNHADIATLNAKIEKLVEAEEKRMGEELKKLFNF